jgi:hemerythrin-like domain-containing protein
MEEKYIFPGVQGALRGVPKDTKRISKLINVLLEQHRKSQILTDLAFKSLSLRNFPDLRRNLRKFVKMYRWHETMEDTVIFELFRTQVTPEKRQEIAELFEKSEKHLFGSGAFRKFLKIVDRADKVFKIEEYYVKA